MPVGTPITLFLAMRRWYPLRAAAAMPKNGPNSRIRRF
jgi:hypothetical protein